MHPVGIGRRKLHTFPAHRPHPARLLQRIADKGCKCERAQTAVAQRRSLAGAQRQPVADSEFWLRARAHARRAIRFAPAAALARAWPLIWLRAATLRPHRVNGTLALIPCSHRDRPQRRARRQAPGGRLNWTSLALSARWSWRRWTLPESDSLFVVPTCSYRSTPVSAAPSARMLLELGERGKGGVRRTLTLNSRSTSSSITGLNVWPDLAFKAGEPD